MYEFLTKLFKEVDGNPEAITAEELVKRIQAEKGLKIVNLEDGGYVSKEKFDAKNTELAGVKQQLTDANKEIQSYKDMDIDGIKKSAKEWETKYNTDTAALNEKLEAQERSHQMDMLMAGYKFTSKAAESGIRALIEAKEYKLENGEFLGAKDYIKSLMENEDYKGAFVQEDKDDPENNGGGDQNQNQNTGVPGAAGVPGTPGTPGAAGQQQNNLPYFATGTSGAGAAGAGAGNQNPFANFGFTPVRPLPNPAGNNQ